jgi:serine/threonine protein kinase
MSPNVSQGEARPAASVPADLLGPEDDPRIASVLAAYLADFEAGRHPSREQLLRSNPEIAEALADWFDLVEFVQSAAASAIAAAADIPAEDALPPDTVLGEYRLVREIGRGGMGIVYEAVQVALGRRVALKVLPGTAAIDPIRLQRFRIESHAAAQLHHPHIVPIFAVGSEHGSHFYAMQYIEGRTLAELILQQRRTSASSRGEARNGADRSSSLPKGMNDSSPGSGLLISGAGDAASDDSPAGLGASLSGSFQGRRAFRAFAKLAVQAAEALAYAHTMGVLHRDIKPSNLLVDSRGNLWVTDFGLARLQDEPGLTRTGDMLGTLRYMAPELVLGHRVVHDPRSDVYSLGATFCELLTKKPVFDGRNRQELLRQIAQEEPVAPRTLDPTIPRDLETILLKAMNKQPERRYATAQELAADLRRFIDDQPILARRPGVMERTLRWARRHKELVATALVILVLALAVSPMITAAFWALARRAEAETQKRVDFVIESYPFLHRTGTSAIVEASNKVAPGQTDAATREEASRVLEQWTNFFKQAIDLPPKDVKSRDVIARAYSRLGYAHWMLSFSKATGAGPDPGLLAEAVSDFHRSVDLLEKLLAESPGDTGIRRHLAEAMGVANMGCCLMSAGRADEAMSYYGRAIQLRRELFRGTSSSRASGGRAGTDVEEELDELPYLASMVHLMGILLEARGRAPEAEKLRQQLEDDIVAVAARLLGPEFQSLRRTWATRLTLGQLPILDRNRRRDVMTMHRLALILDPDNAAALNNLAYSLAGSPGDPWFDPAQGLVLARRAVALEPNEWNYLNTLGVAAFRASDWNTAARALRQASTFTGGGAYDLFFLAMTYWHQGNKTDAREMYDRAVAWTDKNKPDDSELRDLRAEAAALLGQPGPKPKRKAAVAPSGLIY